MYSVLVSPETGKCRKYNAFTRKMEADGIGKPMACPSKGCGIEPGEAIWGSHSRYLTTIWVAESLKYPGHWNVLLDDAILRETVVGLSHAVASDLVPRCLKVMSEWQFLLLEDFDWARITGKTAVRVIQTDTQEMADFFAVERPELSVVRATAAAGEGVTREHPA